jgi:hypothetical protein
MKSVNEKRPTSIPSDDDDNNNISNNNVCYVRKHVGHCFNFGAQF